MVVRWALRPAREGYVETGRAPEAYDVVFRERRLTKGVVFLGGCVARMLPVLGRELFVKARTGSRASSMLAGPIGERPCGVYLHRHAFDG